MINVKVPMKIALQILTFILNGAVRLAALNLFLLAGRTLFYRELSFHWLLIGIIIIDIIFCWLWGKWQFRRYVPGSDETVNKDSNISPEITLRLPLVIFCAIPSVWILWLGLWSFSPNIALSPGMLLLSAIFMVFASIAFCRYYGKKELSEKWRKRLVSFNGVIYFGIVGEFLLGIFILLAMSMYGGTFDYEYHDNFITRCFTSVSLSSAQLPENAKQVRLHGRFGFGTSLRWCGRVSEADFLAFAQKNNYKLSDTMIYNANPETANFMVDVFPSVASDYPGLKKPESFYFYNFRYRNCGGFTIIYDRKTQWFYAIYGNR
ncbi:MAG: hypothetical protein WC071_10840 [Victivallaceae bacterium]